MRLLSLLLARAGIAPILRPVVTQNRVPFAVAGNATREQFAFRTPKIIGSGDVNGIVVMLTGWAQLFNTAGATPVGNPYTINKMNITAPSGAQFPITLDGSNRVMTVISGTKYALCYVVRPADLGLAKFTIGDMVWFKGQIDTPGVNQGIPQMAQRVSEVAGSQFLVYTNTTTMSDVDTPGVFTWTGTSPSQPSTGTFGFFVMGYFVNDAVASLTTHFGLGDSLFDGDQTTGSDAHGRGLFQAAMVDADRVSNPKASLNFSVSGGITAATWTSFPYLQEFADFCVQRDICIGTNDVPAGATAGNLTTLQANANTLRGRLRAGKPANGNLMQVHIGPRSSSTDSFLTTGNQSSLTNLGVGGISAQYDAWIDAKTGTNPPDKVCDTTWARANTDYSQADAWKWAVDGITPQYSTTDGTHWNNRVCVLGSAAFRAIYATY